MTHWRTSMSLFDRIFHAVCVLGFGVPLVFGAWFVVDTFGRVWPGLSDTSVRWGVFAALVQSAQIVGIALAFALPVGIGAAVHLEYLAPKHFFTTLAQRSITLLAAVPSVLYGLFGLTLFAILLRMQSMFLTAAFTLALFLFPIIVERTRSALRTVPTIVHEASIALGADPWRALLHVALPLAMPKLVAEVLLIVARALGTAAPLLVVTLLVPVPKVALVEPIAVRIFTSIADADPTQQTIAGASVIVLLLVVVVLHVVAHWLAVDGSTRAQGFHRDGLSERGIA